MKRRYDRRLVLQAVAFTLAITASLVLLLIPGYTEVTQSSDGPEQVTTSTLLETVGPWIFVPLLIPVVLTGLPLVFRGRSNIYASVAAAIALAIFTVLGALSIGWFYLPATGVAFIALFSLSTKPKVPNAHPEVSQ
ncbi:hypothetical protein ACFY5D_02015 [Paeniglutamicibacter sp. NPDC012692]|uniref:hypothetical protein n=1 Tax=Paeniglutamicibacter sp. NPDC012692 TaxID=3364388 RepID=UPI0036B0E797